MKRDEVKEHIEGMISEGLKSDRLKTVTLTKYVKHRKIYL